MRTLTPSPAVTPQQARGARARLPGICEAVLDGSVAVMGTWTIVYHVCLVLRLGVGWAVGLGIAALAVWAVLWRRSHRRLTPGAQGLSPVSQPPQLLDDAGVVDKVLVATTVLAGGLAAVLIAVGGLWPWASALWLLAAVGGTVLALRRLHLAGGVESEEAAGPPGGVEPDARDRTGKRGRDRAAARRGSRGALVALLWATGLAALSVFARRSNPDDLYYVNLSQWVAARGTFPLRDTIFSDLVYPMSSWPPIASYDGLVGTVALLADVRAASVVYLVVPPVATFLAVLALWRLQWQWRIHAVGTALSVSLVFLLFGGGPGYAAPGNLFLTRIWQGKVILLCVAVPTLLVYALRYVERPTGGRAGWLFAGGVAATGLSTSAMFLVPLVALAGAVPLALRRPRRALLGFAAMAGYPLAMGVATLAVGGRSADFFETRRLYRFDPSWFGPEILRDGPYAAIAVAAVLAGALLLPRRAARLMTGVLAVMVGVTFVPGVTEVAFDLVGLGPTLWRVSWVTPIAALVGVLGVRLGAIGSRRVLRVIVPVVVAAVLVASGLPIWSEANGVTLGSPMWKVNYPVTAERVIDAADPGDVVLAPQGLAVTITVLNTEVKTVAPRDYFMDYLRDEPAFHYDERQTLLVFVNEPFSYRDDEEVARALDVVDVDMVCVPIDSWRRELFLRGEGYERATGSGSHDCYAQASDGPSGTALPGPPG